MTPQQFFERLQARWRAAHEKETRLRHQLDYKYGKWWMAPRGKQQQFERAQAAEGAASDAIFAWLDIHSPRDWRHSAPCLWVCDKLTYEDAVTEGPLAVVPPCSYGRYPSDMIRFAQAVA